MNKTEPKKLLKNTLSCAIATTLMGSSAIVFAQEKAAPGANNQPLASSPYGNTPPANTNVDINYSTGVNNINGNKTVNIPSDLQDPTLALEQSMGTPVQPPMGLPQENMGGGGGPSLIRNGGQIDPVEASIGILNAPQERIRELNRELYKKGRILNEGPVTAPKARSDVIVAHVSPGSTSPVIRLFKNRTSTLLLTDITGQPWPIVNYDGLSEEDFIVKRLDNPAPEGYVLSVTPRGSFVSGNLVLVLKGLVSPLNIEFVSAQKEVDVTTEVRVQAKGPNTQYTSIGLPSSIDTALLSVLQGVAPTGAKELKVSTNAVQAWLAKDGSMYVRTRYKIMSPAFDNVTSSPDGTYAYKMIPVPVVLFKVADGRFGEFGVEGF